MRLVFSSSVRRSKKGFTLTEIAIVLGIIGLILGAVWTAASGVYASANSTKVARSLGQYVIAVRSYCNNNSCGAGSTLPSLTVGIPTLGAITTTAKMDATSSAFYIDWSAIPVSSAGQKACMALASAVQTITTSLVGATGSAADGYFTTPASIGAGVNGNCVNSTPSAVDSDTATVHYVAVPGSCATPTGANTTGKEYQSGLPAGLCTGSNTTLGAAFGVSY